jgi:hypothetical protein
MKNFNQNQLTREELSKIKGGGVYRYMCRQGENQNLGYFFLNTETGVWTNILGSVVNSGSLMNCSQDCVPEKVAE